MRLRYLVVILLTLAVVAAIAGRRLVFPQVAASATPISSPAMQSFVVALGVGDKAAAVWDGSITAAGGSILSIQGWRFTDTDAITSTPGVWSWKANTRMAPAGPNESGVGLFQENGIIVNLAASSTPVMLTVTTARHGAFSFSTQDIPFGVTTSFLAGGAAVTQIAAPLQLTSSEEEEDFPSMAQSGDDIYLAYTLFVHGTALRRKPSPPKPPSPTSRSSLAGPEAIRSC